MCFITLRTFTVDISLTQFSEGKQYYNCSQTLDIPEDATTLGVRTFIDFGYLGTVCAVGVSSVGGWGHVVPGYHNANNDLMVQLTFWYINRIVCCHDNVVNHQ